MIWLAITLFLVASTLASLTADGGMYFGAWGVMMLVIGYALGRAHATQ